MQHVTQAKTHLHDKLSVSYCGVIRQRCHGDGIQKELMDIAQIFVFPGSRNHVLVIN